jgi:hypothetical protein
MPAAVAPTQAEAKPRDWLREGVQATTSWQALNLTGQYAVFEEGFFSTRATIFTRACSTNSLWRAARAVRDPIGEPNHAAGTSAGGYGFAFVWDRESKLTYTFAVASDGNGCAAVRWNIDGTPADIEANSAEAVGPLLAEAAIRHSNEIEGVSAFASPTNEVRQRAISEIRGWRSSFAQSGDPSSALSTVANQTAYNDSEEPLGADLRGRTRTTEKQFVDENSTATCSDYWGVDRVCEVIGPKPTLCLARLTCSRIGYVFRNGRIISARMLLTGFDAEVVYKATVNRLGEPERRVRSLQGACFQMTTATFVEPGVKVQFESMNCGSTAAMYGQQEAVIVSLS